MLQPIVKRLPVIGWFRVKNENGRELVVRLIIPINENASDQNETGPAQNLQPLFHRTSSLLPKLDYGWFAAKSARGQAFHLCRHGRAMPCCGFRRAVPSRRHATSITGFKEVASGYGQCAEVRSGRGVPEAADESLP